MNNWRLLLLAVIAVLQPIPSFTEGNLFDGRRECCGHRSNSIAPDIRLHETFAKTGFENRRLESRGNRVEHRQEDAASSSRERLALERNERRFSPSFTRSSTDSRFMRDQERHSRDSFEARDGENRRIYDNRADDQYERDVAYSRRIRISRDDIRTDMGNERSYRVSIDTRRMRTSNERRVSTTEETMAVLRRERDDVTRYQRDSRFISRSQLENTRGRILASRRNYEKENRVSPSLNSRNYNVIEQEERRNMGRTTFDKIAGERRQRDQTRAPNVRTYAAIHRATVEQTSDRRMDSGKTGERVDRLKKGFNEHRSMERENNERRQRDESTLARERSFVLRQSTSDEQRQGPVIATRQIRDYQYNRFSERQETSGNIPHLSRNVATERDESFVRFRRDVRSMERLDESRQRESRMSRDRTISLIRDSRDNARRQEIRYSESSSRADRESRIRDQRDNERNDVNRRDREEKRVYREQSLNRMVRDNERQQSSMERVSRNREDIARVEIADLRRVQDENRDMRERMVTRTVEPRHNSRLTEHMQLDRSRIAEGSRDNKRRDMSRELDDTRESRISAARVSIERIGEQKRETRGNTRDPIEQQRRESRGTIRGSRVDIRREVTRNRGDVRLRERFEVRRENNREHRNRVSAQQSTDIRAARAFEERRDILTRDRDTNIRVESNRDERQNNERSVRNNDIRVAKPAFRHTEVREERTNRASLSENRIQDKVRSIDAVFNVRSNSRNVHYNTRLAKRETMEIRSRNFEMAEERSEGQNMNWQMVFYTLQAAYLYGLLIKMLTEKPNNGKTRKFTWWASPMNLVKVE